MQRFLGLGVTLILLLASSSLWAVSHPYTLELSPHVGGNIYLNGNDQVHGGLLLGARVDFNLPHDFGVELAFSFMPESERSNGLIRTYLDVMYYLYNKGGTNPFVVAGIGFDRIMWDDSVAQDDETAVSINLGVGGKVFVYEMLGFRYDMRYLFTNGPAVVSDGTHSLEITVGFFYDFFTPEPPPSDSDGDTIRDTDDKCPQEVEDFDAFKDDDGCPDKDNDGDGILDVNDHCPDKPESKNGIEDSDGCPEGDRDGDGIIDQRDSCPDKAETPNGFEDDDGCPDVKPPPRAPAQTVARFSPPQAIILFDAKKTALDPQSIALLDELAAALNSYPTATVKLVGHTSSRGNKKTNAEVSLARAEVVKAYLLSKGIDGQRITISGLGGDAPIADNRTPDGRKQNERVEIVLVP